MTRAFFQSLLTAYLLQTTAAADAASPAAPIALAVGAMPIDPSAEVFYAQEKGFFKAAGLDVKLTVLNNGSAVLAAAASGNLDVGFASPAPLLQARSRGIPVRFIAPAVVYGGTPNSVLVVAKDSPIRSAADLSGKTVAVSGLRDLTYFSTQAWLDKNGGNAASIQFVEIPYAEIGAALQAGRISAGCLIEPFITGMKDTRILANLNGAVANQYLLAGWFAMDSWVQKNPDAVKRFVSAVQQAARWGNAHQAESAGILARYTGTSPADAATMTRARYDTGPDVSPQWIQPVIDLLQKYGKMTGLPAASDVITNVTR